MVVIGSGVTGVEFTHIFESMDAEVTLVVSRQQILPHRDPEVAAVLEEDFLERGVRLVIGARAGSHKPHRRRCFGRLRRRSSDRWIPCPARCWLNPSHREPGS